MVLLNFKEAQAANIYFKQYNNRTFSSLEPETCQVLHVKSIEMNPAHSLFTLTNNEETCSVCLEPLDENKSGILTIFCQHAFHCHCLLKWRDGSCPVCRYSQNKKITESTEGSSKLYQETEERAIEQNSDDDNECTECKAKENLWICLICGHVGCGRYHTAHAYEHFKETDHIYALEIASERVWDYASDGFVHRLIQNDTDGKIVELPDNHTSDHSSQQEKAETLALEYSYMLTSQLDSQRIYYEDQMDSLSNKLSKLANQIKQIETQNKSTLKENECIEQQIAVKEKELASDMTKKKCTEEVYEAWKDKLEFAKSSWLKEKQMTNSLLQSNEALLKSKEIADQNISELNDQVRDLMFFLEARRKVQIDPDLEGGSVETRQTISTRRKKGKRKSEK
ncbi:unnamed protein product [Rhizopus stolonifer]